MFSNFHIQKEGNENAIYPSIYLIFVAVVITVVETRASERMLKAMVLLEVLVAQRYPLVVDINSQAALSILQG